MSKSQSRLEKLENLDDPYPRDFPNRERIKSVLWQYKSNIHAKETITPDLDPSLAVYKIAGRIMARRDHGDNIFFDLMDQTGTIQLHAKRLVDGWDQEGKILEESAIWEDIQECDLGDMVGVEGTISANSRGKPLFLISNWTLLAKALREPPDKHHGLNNPEVKYRHRELDLLSSADSRAVFQTRAKIIFEIRKYLNERDFIEIECPVLQAIYGGATARPFITRHNSLDQDFYLSISSELFLKRAMIGGFDRVYSFSRCFRNEGISPTHNPEFTNLEIFESCKTADDMRKFTENLLEFSAHSVGSLLLPMDFERSLPSKDWPLSRKKNPNPNHYKNEWEADAWELFINGMEIASGASDLNDPHEQEKRLEESEFNAITRSENPDNAEFDPMDRNYIEALEQGALPWAGVGIGIDRLVMLLTGKTNIRDVIAFPTLKG